MPRVTRSKTDNWFSPASWCSARQRFLSNNITLSAASSSEFERPNKRRWCSSGSDDEYAELSGGSPLISLTFCKQAVGFTLIFCILEVERIWTRISLCE